MGARDEYFVGKPVCLQGTGRRWSGETYPATIVDVDKQEGTVKVQYSDGGYKRFQSLAFREAVVGDGETNARMDYGSQAYEWYYENFAPDQEEIDLGSKALNDLRQKVAAHTRKGEFEQAAKVQEEFKRQQKFFTEGQKLKEELLSAVQKEDFLKAAEAKEKLNKFRMQRKKSISSPSGTSAGLAVTETKSTKSFGEILQSAGKRALGGGMAGAAAMVVQVSSLMWMRTTMNYQYRYGVPTMEAFRLLYKEGGVLRFYRGYVPALAQGPLSRFGDTAANAGVLALMENSPYTAALPPAVKTLGASFMASISRIGLTPIDTVKTIMQVEGRQGVQILRKKAAQEGFTVYYHGALATAGATFAGHYPWFATYNTLQEYIPQQTELPKKLLRNAGIGFVSSVISDTVSNSLRVVKTYKQTNPETISYGETVKRIVEKDGYAGLFGRGLKTRIMANGMQGLMFSVMWKMFDDELRNRGFFK